jgi:hypothetical protein
MSPQEYTGLQKGMTLLINGLHYAIKEIIIPADHVEDRMRQFLDTVQGVKEEKVVLDFRLHDDNGEEYILKIRDQPTYFWNVKFGFREEDLIEIESIEVVQ